MKNLRHPNLMKLVYVCWEDEMFTYCLEYVSNGHQETEQGAGRDILGGSEAAGGVQGGGGGGGRGGERDGGDEGQVLV